MPKPNRAYPPPVADIGELAYQTGIAPSTIRLYVKNGWLPAPHKGGNKRLWLMTEVISHIARIEKMEEKEGALPQEFDEYEESIRNVAPKQKQKTKANDRAA